MRTTPSRIVSVGRQPSARIRAQSRKMNGLSPTQPRSPPVYVRCGVTPSASQIQPIESLTSQYSSVPRLKMLTFVRGLVEREQHRVDAVLHVEVRLALPAVAEHAQLSGRMLAGCVEVEHVAVRVALAEDRDEAEDRSPACRSPRSRPAISPSPASFEAPYSEVCTGNGASSGVGKIAGSP